MSSEEPEDEIRSVVEAGAREVTLGIQEKIQEQFGKRISEGELQRIVEPAMNEIAEITIQASSHYSGPMPSPHVMQGYVQLYPQAAEQLFKQFKEEQAHRHAWENAARQDNANERRRRDYSAYMIVALGIMAACYIAYLGAHQIAAFLIGTLVLGGGALLLGRQLLMKNDKDGTVVHVNSEDEKHSNTRSQKSSQKQKARPRSQRSGR